MNKSVIVFGPAGCGKTTNAVRLAQHFGLNKIADEADLSSQPTHRGWELDTLYLVQERPTWAPEEARRVIEFYDAMALAKAGAA
jgi:adenylate kinase family enzyme